MPLSRVNGPSLFEHLCESPTYTESTVRFYLEQLCQALAHLHRGRVIHLDLRPRNVLLDVRENKVKLVDFGAAQRVELRFSGNGPSAVRGRHFAAAGDGSPEFHAPEVISSGPVGTYTDMWSFGLLIYVSLR